MAIFAERLSDNFQCSIFITIKQHLIIIFLP